MKRNRALKPGTQIVKVGPHRRVVTIVDRTRVGAEIFYLAIGRCDEVYEISHKALAIGIRRGEYEIGRRGLVA